MTSMIKPLLYSLFFLCSIQIAYSQNETNKSTMSNIVENLQEIGGPFQISQYDVEDIITINNNQGIDDIELYAWSKLYEETHNMSKHIIKYLNSKLSEEQIKSAGNRVQELDTAFEKHELLDNYTPAYPYKITNLYPFEVVPLKTVPPNYPIKARMNYIQGYVELGFNIYKDNTVRDIYVVKQYPKHHFTKEAIQAISQYQLKLESGNKKSIEKEYQKATQKLYYLMKKYYSMKKCAKFKLFKLFAPAYLCTSKWKLG